MGGVERRREGAEEGQKGAILGSGVTGGVTKWGYIFEKVGLQIRGFRGVGRRGGKRKKNRDR